MGLLIFLMRQFILFLLFCWGWRAGCIQTFKMGTKALICWFWLSIVELPKAKKNLGHFQVSTIPFPFGLTMSQSILTSKKTNRYEMTVH